MIIKISHYTSYTFTNIVPRLVQSLKLYPSVCKNQKIIDWKILSNKGSIVDSHIDSLGHKILNIYSQNLQGNQIIISEGKVETKNLCGTLSGLREKVNPFCFLRSTSLTKPGKKIIELSKKTTQKQNEIKFFYELNSLVFNAIKFKSGSTDNQTSAEEALKKGEGVCQDFAHILISLARVFKVPARYINGYLIEEHNYDNYSTHAWVEIFIESLGWVGFDPSHNICINEKYIRVNCGYDFIDASPIKGVKLNYLGSEKLTYKVDINVSQ